MPAGLWLQAGAMLLKLERSCSGASLEVLSRGFASWFEEMLHKLDF